MTIDSKTLITNITSKDIHTINKIGEVCLPIYYSASDILFLLFDNNYIMLKITNSNYEIMGFVIAKKKFHHCNQHDDDDDSNDLNFFGKNSQPIIRFHIMSIGILPKYRKKGYAGLLINKLKTHIKKYYNYSIKLSLFVLTNNEAAIKLYEKHKFRKIFKDDHYYETLPVKSAYYYET